MTDSASRMDDISSIINQFRKSLRENVEEKFADPLDRCVDSMTSIVRDGNYINGPRELLNNFLDFAEVAGIPDKKLKDVKKVFEKLSEDNMIDYINGKKDPVPKIASFLNEGVDFIGNLISTFVPGGNIIAEPFRNIGHTLFSEENIRVSFNFLKDMTNKVIDSSKGFFGFKKKKADDKVMSDVIKEMSSALSTEERQNTHSVSDAMKDLNSAFSVEERQNVRGS